MTITSIPYSPIKVETSLFIEKEVDVEDDGLEKAIADLSKKIEEILNKDIENKLIQIARKQKEMKEKIEGML